ncbi:MAG: CoA-binding protein [Nitrososphaerales archaeon]
MATSRKTKLQVSACLLPEVKINVAHAAKSLSGRHTLFLMIEVPIENPHQEEIMSFLKRYKTIAVIGMSKNPEKDANQIPAYLMAHGYRVIPVNPSAEEILGQKSYKNLAEVPGDIDIVDVFRPSEDVPNYVKDVISKKPKVFWLQLGIHNPEAEKLVSENGIKVVFDRCIMQEHRKLASIVK